MLPKIRKIRSSVRLERRRITVILALMDLNYNELQAVVYADLFDWPLTLEEARFWAIAGESSAKKWQWKPSGRKVKRRAQKEKIAEKKILLAKKIAGSLAR